MSWFKSYASLEDFKNENPSLPNQEAPEDQLAAARKAAELLIASESVGKDKDFIVSVSGHTNPGHEPSPGWANDCITVSVSQKS